jgi:selenocysteine lyase/cysteine desulfurase
VLAADRDLLDGVEPDKLLPATDEVPERFELGTLPYELLAGTTATVDYIADLLPGNGTGRRARLLASMAAVQQHEDRLFARLLEGLQDSGATVYGRPKDRTPTVLFSLPGMEPQEVYRRLAARGVNAPAGSFYALEASRWAGLGDTGAVRAGLAPYTDDDDVDRLLAGVADLCR